MTEVTNGLIYAMNSYYFCRMKWIAKLILKIWGYELRGPNPGLTDKYIMVAAPHTSNWDFPLGILAKISWKFPINWLGKSSLFKPWYGFFFKALGGVSVKRDQNNNMVDAIIQLIEQRSEFALCIAPEGTRAYAETLKSGFYHIARGADIPIITCMIDYNTKSLTFSHPISLKDMSFQDSVDFLKQQFQTAVAKFPDQTIFGRKSTNT